MKEFIAKCQHCGNETTQIILHQEIKEDVGFDSNRNPHPYLDFYCFTVCNTCKSFSFFSIIDNNDGNEFSLYPMEQSIHSSIPASVSKVYIQALKIRKISPVAFLMLIRKSLEIICKDQNAEGKNLHQKIEFLYKQNKIPILILEVANKTKFIGNCSAHESDFECTEEDAETINDLFQAIIEYIYVIPYKLSKLTEIMKPILNKELRKKGL